jgi:hypothetical protein
VVRRSRTDVLRAAHRCRVRAFSVTTSGDESAARLPCSRRPEPPSGPARSRWHAVRKDIRRHPPSRKCASVNAVNSDTNFAVRARYTGGTWFEDREVDGAMYRVTNATSLLAKKMDSQADAMEKDFLSLSKGLRNFRSCSAKLERFRHSGIASSQFLHDHGPVHNCRLNTSNSVFDFELGLTQFLPSLIAVFKSCDARASLCARVHEPTFTNGRRHDP